MAHVPIEPDPAAVASTALAEPEPTPATTAKILCFKMHSVFSNLYLLLINCPRTWHLTAYRQFTSWAHGALGKKNWH